MVGGECNKAAEETGESYMDMCHLWQRRQKKLNTMDELYLCIHFH